MLEINFAFLWTAINLLVLYLFLKKFLFGRVGAFMESRAQAIEDDIAAAREQREQADSDRQQMADELNRTREECGALVESARVQAVRKAEEIVAEANREAARRLADARDQAEREREQAAIELRGEVAALAMAAVGRVLAENLDSDKNRALVKQFLEDQDGGAA